MIVYRNRDSRGAPAIHQDRKHEPEAMFTSFRVTQELT